MVRFRFRLDPTLSVSFIFGLVIGVSSLATLVCATFIILQPSSLKMSCNLNNQNKIFSMWLQRKFSIYFNNDVELPNEERRLSMSTVYWQICKAKIHICAVSFSRRRGGTVLNILKHRLMNYIKIYPHLSCFRVRSLIFAIAYTCKALSCNGRGASSGNGSMYIE